MPQPQLPAIVPHLVCRDASAAIEFYKKAFGFKEAMRLNMPGSTKIMHACLMLDSGAAIFLVDESPDMPGCTSPLMLKGTPVTMHMNVKDVDATFARAVAAGATVAMPVADMFWGDRYGSVIDPFGHAWSMATPKENVSMDEIKNRVNAMAKQT